MANKRSNLQSQSDPDAAVEPRDGGINCSYCGNKRYVVDAQGQLKACSHCTTAAEWRVNSVRTYSSRAGIAQMQVFDNYKTTLANEEEPHLLECLRAAQAFATNFEGKWLVIWGRRGNGKSHLCAAVDNYLMFHGVPSLFITMPDLLSSLRQAMDMQTNTEQESYSGRMNVFKTVPVLILDDLGAESGSPWSDGVLFEVLDYRYRNRLATMIATNVNPDDFDPRIASRMQDTEFCTVIENAAPDYRRRSKDARA